MWLQRSQALMQHGHGQATLFEQPAEGGGAADGSGPNPGDCLPTEPPQLATDTPTLVFVLLLLRNQRSMFSSQHATNTLQSIPQHPHGMPITNGTIVYSCRPAGRCHMLWQHMLSSDLAVSAAGILRSGIYSSVSHSLVSHKTQNIRND